MTSRFWSSLRRVTTSGRYIPEIDGLRFVAIAAVLVYHFALKWNADCPSCALSWTAPWVLTYLHLDRGVVLFFSISGLILGLPFVEQHIQRGRPVRLRAYFLRRLTRLEPPYLINLLLRFPLLLLLRQLSARTMLPHLLASFFYLNWVIYGEFPALHPPSWSLEVEVQFYLLAPLIAALCYRWRPAPRRIGLAVLILAFSTIRANTPVYPGSRFNLSLACFAQYFLLGMLMADGFVTVLPRLKDSWLWDVAAIPLWCVMFRVTDRTAAYLLPPIFLVLFTAAFKGRLLRMFWRNRFVTTVGGMCYSLYLTHSLLLEGCYLTMQKLHLWNGYHLSYILSATVCMSLILVGGTLFFVLIERPCMARDWPRTLLRSLRQHTGLRVGA